MNVRICNYLDNKLVGPHSCPGCLKSMITLKEENFQLQHKHKSESDSNQTLKFPLKAPSAPNHPTTTTTTTTTRLRKGSSTNTLKKALENPDILIREIIYAFLGWASVEENESTEDVISDEGVTCVEWHPFKTCAAFIHSSSRLYIHSFTSNAWLPSSNSGYKHPLLTNATCMAWHPFASATLAVGTRTGVVVWRWARDMSANLSEPLSQGVMPLFTALPSSHPVPWIQHLEMPQVSCIRWSPCGRWLIAGSQREAGMWVWDVRDWQRSFLKGGSARGGSLDIAVHPDSEWVIQILRGSGLVVWETHSWSMSKLTTVSECSSLYWLANTKIFLFSLAASSNIHMLQMKADAPNLDVTNAPSLILPSLDDDEGFLNQQMGIKRISVDPSGKRLAVTFEGEINQNRVGLYAIAMRPLPELVAIGWVYAEGACGGSEGPVVTWGNRVKHGALMGVRWDPSLFTNVPLYF